MAKSQGKWGYVLDSTRYHVWYPGSRPLARAAKASLRRLAPRRCRLALTPGRPPQTGGLRAGDALARGRGAPGDPGHPGGSCGSVVDDARSWGWLSQAHSPIRHWDLVIPAIIRDGVPE
jgi:hypothetical protein